MNHSRSKTSLMFISLFCFSLLLLSSPKKLSYGIDVTPNTRVDLADVVNVNYTLWVENLREDDQEGTVYVINPDQPVPTSIIDDFPDIRVPPNVGFREAMMGMKAGDSKNVDIYASSGKGFNNFSDPFFGKDLYYQIRLKEILLDSSSPPLTPFDIPFFTPLLILFSLILVILIILRIQRFNKSHNIFGLKRQCYICKKIATVKCGNSGCEIPYCKECFLERGCRLCNSNMMIPLR
ncbi:MAG: hypothetical protein ACW97X_11040, partial [Candidatus Hodarchaeales archaeon]